ncbi:ATP-binding protein [Streptomyces sp. NPDC093595]|uniref:ATP-binding protein n=1 Tax=Streptomyces sp. NPDC093595 TaxID=3366045 RepID=UPI003829E3CC
MFSSVTRLGSVPPAGPRYGTGGPICSLLGSGCSGFGGAVSAVWWVKGCRLPSRHHSATRAAPLGSDRRVCQHHPRQPHRPRRGRPRLPARDQHRWHAHAHPPPPAPPRRREPALEHAPEAAATARHTVQSVLETWQDNDEAIDAVVLVASELVTNAVEHARAPLSLHLHREHTGNRVWVGVTDGGPSAHNGPWARLNT